MSAPKPMLSFAEMVDEALKLDPRAAVPVPTDPRVPVEQTVDHPAYGWLRTVSHVLPGMHLTFIEAQLYGQDVFMPENANSDDVSTVFLLRGGIHTQFSELDTPIDMRPGRHSLVRTIQSGGYHILRADEPFEAVHLCMQPDVFRNLLDPADAGSAPLLHRLDRAEAFTVAPPEASRISATMYDTLAGLKNCPLSGHMRRLYLEARATELLALQLDYFQQLAPGATLPRPTPAQAADRDRLHALRDYLDVHFLHDHTLGSLARRFGLNEFKLKKGFKALFDDTVFGYIHRLRMHHARTLLLERHLTVAEAADVVGYANANHFSTAFKRFFGVSPGMVKEL